MKKFMIFLAAFLILGAVSAQQERSSDVLANPQATVEADNPASRGDCYPAKDLTVVYADDCSKATLTWSPPPLKIRAMWDLRHQFDAQNGGMVAVGTDGKNYYVANWQSSGANLGLFEQYDMMGNFLGSFKITGVQEVRALAYDGTYFYAGAGPVGSGNIRILDMENKTQVGVIPNTGGGTLRHLSYDPTLDGGNGGFWLGDWTTMRAIKRDGTIIHNNATVANVYGSAYDPYTDPKKPCLWLYCQPAYSADPFSSRCIIQQFDIKTRKLTSFKYDTAKDFDYEPPGIDPQANPGSLAGGAVAYLGDDGIYYLAVNVQTNPNLVLIYELGEPVILEKEYNVYRGSEKLTETPILATTFEDITYDKTKGYTWSVKVACVDGSESDAITSTMEACFDGKCKPVTELSAVLNGTDNKIEITWTAPPPVLTPEKYIIFDGETELGDVTTTTYEVDISTWEIGAYTKKYCVLPVYAAGVCEGDPKACIEKTFYVSVKDFINTFSIRPNPAKSNTITIDAKSNFNKIEVVNFLGQTVITEQNTGNSATLDISTLTNGVYFVRIATENGASVMKFVKQ